MILITGSTGFIGNVLTRQLVNLEYPVKLLLRPSKKTPQLPKEVPLEVAVTSLNDDRGLRAAMKGVKVIYHLASAESLGRKAELATVDIQGTQSVVQAAEETGVERIFFLSHLGAARASAYPLLRAKALAENSIKNSGIPYTIFRSAVSYGEFDHFTNGLAFLLKISPYLVMLPEDGTTLLQPIWVEDLVTILTWSLELPQTINETIEVGGPEFISFRQICELIIDHLGIRRQFVNVAPVLLTYLTELLEILVPHFPTSVFWLDYLATNRTTQMDVLPRIFNLLPARMNQRLAYLEGKKFNREWRRILRSRKRTT